MSTDLLHEAIPPLAWDHNEQPFVPPAEAVAWRVRRYTGEPGRPPGVWTSSGLLHVGLDSDIGQLRRMVKVPGSYRLYPVDKAGQELTPIACVEIVPERPEQDGDGDDLDPEDQDGTALALVAPGDHGLALRNHLTRIQENQNRFFDTYERMLASRDRHDELLGQMLMKMVTTTAQIQEGTAALLMAANRTVKVANGVESFERMESPPLDVQELANKLQKAIGSGKDTTPIWLQLLNSPIGKGLAEMAMGFGTFVVQNQMANKQAPAEEPVKKQD